MSNLIEIGGTGSIILKPLADFTVNGVTYKANKLFYAQADCGIQFQYSSTNAQARQGQNTLMSSQKLALRNLSITHLPLSTKILSFYKREHEGGLKCPIIETKPDLKLFIVPPKYMLLIFIYYITVYVFWQ